MSRLARPDAALAASLVVFVAGIVRDVQWHATHDTQTEFETAAKQVEVHWLLWLGALGLLAVSALALSRLAGSRRRRGHSVVLGSAVAYAVVSVWHFIEHANGNDPQLAHLLLYACSIGLLAGAILALAAAGPARRGQIADQG